MRLSRAHDPWGRAAWVDGKRLACPNPVWLSRFIAQNLNRCMDLDVEYERGNGKHKRMVGPSPPAASRCAPATSSTRS
jgi:hypothetical protein